MPEILLIYTTFESMVQATPIVQSLIEDELVACANCIDMQSMYTWQGSFQQGKEVIVILKSTPDKENAIRKVLESIHPYEVPCILSWRGTSNVSYAAWIAGATGLNAPR